MMDKQEVKKYFEGEVKGNPSSSIKKPQQEQLGDPEDNIIDSVNEIRQELDEIVRSLGQPESKRRFMFKGGFHELIMEAGMIAVHMSEIDPAIEDELVSITNGLSDVANKVDRL